MSPFSEECVAEFECIFMYDTMTPTTMRVARLARKYGLTKAQVFSWFGYRRRKVLKNSAAPSTPVEIQPEANVVPARGSKYSEVMRSMYTPEQLEELQQADEADRDFLELIM